MKKKLIALVSAAVLAVGATFVYAAPPETVDEARQVMNVEQMLEFHKQMLDEQVKNGNITAEQAAAMNDHMSKMAPYMQQMMGGMGPAMMGNAGMWGNGQVICPGFQSSNNQK